MGVNYCVKISDLGMSQSMYSCDYYHADGSSVGLPIRWMAWESLILVSQVFIRLIFIIRHYIGY